MVYDVTDKSSFLNVPFWIEEVYKLNKDNHLILVLGNKNDLEKKEVDEEDIKSFNVQHNVEVIEASAKSSYNIEATMIKIGDSLIKKFESKKRESGLSGDRSYTKNNIKIGNNTNSNKKGNIKTKLSDSMNKCNCG